MLGFDPKGVTWGAHPRIDVSLLRGIVQQCNQTLNLSGAIDMQIQSMDFWKHLGAYPEDFDAFWWCSVIHGTLRNTFFDLS